jgi:putative phage-type endonuclease
MPRLTDQQRAERRLGIGSSDIPTILGLSPYQDQSPVLLWLEKTGQWVPEESPDSSAMELGHLVEPVLCAHYARQSGLTILREGQGVESVRHPVYGWRRCNLDGRIADRSAAVEIKFVGMGMARHWDLLADDGIPHYVRAQVAWQMHVADLAEVHVIACVGGPAGFRGWIIPRDIALEEAIVRAAHEFHELVIAGIQPELDGSAGVRAWLDEKYPPRGEDVVWVVEDQPVIQVGVDRCDAARAEKVAQASKKRTSNLLVQAMGERGATVATCDHWRATYRASKAGERRLLVKDLRALAAADVTDDGMEVL